MRFFLAFLFLTAQLNAALTLVTRETFQSVGTLNSGTPGNLGTVTGSFYKRPVGPRVTGDTSASSLGWSSDLRSANAYHTLIQTAGSTTQADMVCGWYYIASVSGSNFTSILAMDYNGTQDVNMSLRLDPSMSLSAYGGLGTVVNSAAPLTLTPNTWYWFAIARVKNGTYNADFKAYYKTIGGSVTLLATITNSNNGYYGVCTIRGGNYPGGVLIKGRYGMPSYYTISSFADVASPSDVVDPPSPTTRFNWYVNPSTGSDTNDGVTSSTAWATAAKINEESAYSGMFSKTTGYVNGDILHIDCSAARLPVLTTPIQIFTQGLTVLQTGGALEPLKTITGTWSTTAYSGVYSTDNGGDADMLSTVIYEDGKYLNHPIGADIASVQASLVSTPGSFWTDGTTMYLHPFSNSDPRSDGKTYKRTRNRGRTGFPLNADSVVVIQAKDVWWDGLTCSGTTLARMTDNDPLGAYCFQWESGAGGTNLLSNFNVSNYSKHAVGTTITGTNAIYERRDGVYSQGPPYKTGGSTTDVDYAGSGGTTTGNQSIYTRCTESVNNIALIGSATGTTYVDAGSWYSHGQASGNFASATFTDCVWQSSFADEGVISQITMLRCKLAYATLNTAVTFNQCQSTAGLLGTASGALVIRNSILVTGSTPAATYFSRIPAAGGTIEGCTIDLRASTSGGAKAVWGRISSGTALTIRNVFLIGSASDTRVLLTGFSSSDTLTITNNAYAVTGGLASLSYNDGSTTSDRTLAQWQTLGKDAGSFATTVAASIGSDYKPISGSSLINVGVNIGPLTDFAGLRTFNPRNDIGACEFYIPFYPLGFKRLGF